MKNRIIIGIIFLLGFTTFTKAQVAINEDDSQPDASALLDIKSTTKGMLIPRMTTTQRTGISSPAQGLMVYDITTNSFWYFSTAWTELNSDWTKNNNDISNTNTGNVGIGTNSPKEKLDINGSIQIGEGNNSTPTAGAIRWNNTTKDFEGYMGDRWASLTFNIEPNLDSLKDFSNAQSHKKTANSNVLNSQYGHAVSITDNYAIIGAPTDINDNNVMTGVAYIFMRDGLDWILQAKIVGSDVSGGNQFGYAVAITNEYAYVSTKSEVIAGAYSGSVYEFKRNGSTWIQQAKLVPSNPSNGDIFGASISVSGNDIIIGVPHDDINGYDEGSAYIFTKSGNTWTQQAKLTASDLANDNYFGASVSISGDYAVVGALYHDLPYDNAGAAYVFKRTGVTWSQIAKLASSDIGYGDYFGTSVFISGDELIVGATGANGNSNDHGAAYIFTRSGNTWTQQSKLIAADGAIYDAFGKSVYMSGDYAIIGASLDDDHGNSSGSAYIFKRNGNTWLQDAKLIAPDGAANARYGEAVCISSNGLALVGAPDASPNKAYFINAGTSLTSSDNIHIAGKGSMSLSSLASVINTDNQDLSLSNNILSLTNDASTVDLSPYFNTDNQDLTLSGNTLSLTNDATAVDLSSYHQDLTLSGNTLSLTNDATAVILPWTTSGSDIYSSNSGNIGIGTNTPTKAKLQIEGVSGTAFSTSNYAYFTMDNSNNHVVNSFGAASRNYSLYASGQVLAKEFNAFSDKRIKNIKGISDSENDLATLMQIEITDYQMRDTIEKGNKTYKKVIAQQVAKVFPQAVDNQLTDVVPDIFKKAPIKDGWIELATNLKAGDRVKIITETTNEIYEVTAAEATRFQVNFPSSEATVNHQPSTVFVYGREVNDFHTVDYEAISMLNVSATQQLAKENEALKARINNIEKENAALKAQVNQISELKAILEQLQQQVNGTTVVSSKK